MIPPTAKKAHCLQQINITFIASIDLFCTQRINVTSISEICKKASISRDTFYRCFTDKDELIDHLYQTAVNDHMEALMATPDLDYTNPNWVEYASDHAIDGILKRHKTAQFIFVESADPNSHTHELVQNALKKVAKGMQAWSKNTYGVTPGMEFLLSILNASQWLVHNAIINGMTPTEIKKAKAACTRLFYMAMANPEGLN